MRSAWLVIITIVIPVISYVVIMWGSSYFQWLQFSSLVPILVSMYGIYIKVSQEVRKQNLDFQQQIKQQIIDHAHQVNQQRREHCLQVAINSDMVKEIDSKNRDFALEVYETLYSIGKILHETNNKPLMQKDEHFDMFYKYLKKLHDLDTKYTIWLDDDIYDLFSRMKDFLARYHMRIVAIGKPDDKYDDDQTEMIKKLGGILEDFFGEIKHDNFAEVMRKKARAALNIDDAHLVRQYIFKQAASMTKEES